MFHPNKNKLLTLFYHEGTKREEKKIRDHVRACESCQQYLETLGQISNALGRWRDEQPSPETLDFIMARISIAPLKSARSQPIIATKPMVQIAFAIGLILSLIYLIQYKIEVLPIWQSLEQWWFIEAIGSFGVALILFFCLGTFITLALAPILILEKAHN